MIPADRFYRAILDELKTDSRFSFVRGRVTAIQRAKERAIVTAAALPTAERAGCDEPVWRPLSDTPGAGTAFSADLVVDTILSGRAEPSTDHPPGAQTFVGWEVEVEQPVWDPRNAILMDFSDRTETDRFAFTYILPISPYRALVEHTVVGWVPPTDSIIEARLEAYLERVLSGGDFRIVRREKGQIPLLLHRAPRADGPILQLGVTAGAARPSTGYAFRSIVETSRAAAASVVALWRQEIDTSWSSLRIPRVDHANRRPRFFDSVFLTLLETEPDVVPSALLALFRNNPSSRVLRFLDGKSSWWDDLHIVFTLPWPPFLRAFLRTVRGDLPSNLCRYCISGEEQL